ncbi:MAG: hypothetical protein JSW62_02115 [Thermoplasmatales archaeon]|nr:MAG: hypothetical protein JSW62_02115 [Thermoplasmatales archaeon]
MNEQKKLICKGDWDILIIIDACRYDFFEETYRNFFGDAGELKKIITPATWTGAWVAEIFHGEKMKDTIFISSHKWINSEGPSDEQVRIFSERLKYGKMIRELDATKIFKDIVDVWKFGYDERIRAISPDIMTEETIKALDENPDSRVITKYFQIHDPYIYYVEDQPKKRKKISFENLQNFIGTVISDEVLCKLREMTGRLPVNALSYYYLKYGKEGIRKGYREDLKIMFKYIKKIVDRFPNKKVVITSDHGERLGEGGDFGHSGQHDKIITEVPWYEISPRK